MTREEAKELLSIIQAFVAGKQIQDAIEGLTDWVDTDKEVNEVITDFESAKKYLVGKTNDVFGVVKKNVYLKALTQLKMPKYLLKNSTQSTLKHLLR